VGVDQSKNQVIGSITARDITGSFLVDSEIQNSFNAIQRSEASDELKQQLQLLATEVQNLCKKLPEDKAAQTARDLKSFTEEATAKEPRKSVLEVFGNALTTVAESVGTIGGPVVSLVKAVLPLVGA
jgi:hypothetical protein